MSPESIVVNRLGSWKLCGFEFACDGTEGECVNIPSWQSSIPTLCQPHLDYSAPEVVIEVSLFAISIGIFICYPRDKDMQQVICFPLEC